MIRTFPHTSTPARKFGQMPTMKVRLHQDPEANRWFLIERIVDMAKSYMCNVIHAQPSKFSYVENGKLVNAPVHQVSLCDHVLALVYRADESPKNLLEWFTENPEADADELTIVTWALMLHTKMGYDLLPADAFEAKSVAFKSDGFNGLRLAEGDTLTVKLNPRDYGAGRAGRKAHAHEGGR